MKRDMHSALVALQQGVFSRRQAVEAGLTLKMIDARLRSGKWRRVFRGVYTNSAGDVGRPGMLWAAVLSAGRYAVLSHQTAAELVLGGRPAGTFDEMCGWITRALATKRTTAVKLSTAMSERQRLRWRSVVGDMITATITGDHSVLEHRYERDVERGHGLPEPERQVPFTAPDGSRGRRDRVYRTYGVVIELDGQLYHPAEETWKDKDRDNAAIEAGFESLRYGWRHVTQGACATAVQVGRILRDRGWPGQPRPCSVRCPVRQSS